MKRAAAELLEIFALVFAGTGAIVVAASPRFDPDFVTSRGIALTFGLIVLVMIYVMS